MLPVIFSLLLSANIPSACGDSLAKAEDVASDDLGAVTPDEDPEDSCQWEAPRAQYPEWEGESERESARESVRELNRASLSVAQAPGSPVTSTFRQQAEIGGWKTRLELQEDTLTRRQLSWNKDGWHWTAGDMNDPLLPLWPKWLPRRALPAGWNAAPGSNAFFANTPFPQGFGARVASGAWDAYAVSAWDPVQVRDVPPWEKPWTLRDFAAGTSVSLPWIASLQFAETQISRDDADSAAEALISLGLASPQKRLALNAAWSSSQENPAGGWAWGAQWKQSFSDSAKLAFTLRERGSHWSSLWDPTSSSDSSPDSGMEGGAGEAIASLRIPFHLRQGKGFVSGETWGAWNPEAGTGKFGARSEVEWRTPEMLLEARGMYRQWENASGSTGFHDFLALETGLGRDPKWRTGVYRIWEPTSTRQGLSFALDARWREWRVRPGMLVESTKDRELSGSASLDLHWRLGKGWALEADGAAPCEPAPAWSQARWRATLRYLR